MTKSNYLNDYAESFAIFAKYGCDEGLNLNERGIISISPDEEVSPEDHALLLGLGWTLHYGEYWKDER